MRRHTRGSTITLFANSFKDRDGDAVTPDTVTFYLDFPIASRGRDTETLTGVLSGTEWSADWDSGVAFAGTVFWTAKAVGDDNFVGDESFQLVANQSNPDP